jgi:hypothetical protein
MLGAHDVESGQAVKEQQHMAVALSARARMVPFHNSDPDVGFGQPRELLKREPDRAGIGLRRIEEVASMQHEIRAALENFIDRQS